MADESVTLDQEQTLEPAREREFANLDRQYRLNQRRQERTNNRQSNRGRAATINFASDSISNQAEMAWAQAWAQVHEAVEDFSFAWFGVGFLIAGPVATILYIIRVVGAYMFGGFGRIQSPRLPSWIPAPENVSISVPLVPRFLPAEGIYRTGKIVLMAALTFIVYGALVLLAFVLLHPLDTVKSLGLNSIPFVVDVLKYFGLPSS